MPQELPNGLSEMLSSYTLYNRDIERFFLESCLFKHEYKRGEEFASVGHLSDKIVAYIHSGLFKTYMYTSSGNKSFAGYTPRYSTLITLGNASVFGKGVVANIDSVVYFAPANAYVEFVRSSNELTLHQMREPYFRRNINDLPKMQSIHMPARIRVYEYILLTVLSFGRQDPANKRRWTFRYPPTIKDIANYVNAHQNNVSTFLAELDRMGLIERSPRELAIPDAPTFSKILAQMKEQSAG